MIHVRTIMNFFWLLSLILSVLMEVLKWKTGISAEGLSGRLLLHNTLQKWTEILEKRRLAKYEDLLFLSFSVTIFLSVSGLCSFLIEISQIGSWSGCSSGVGQTHSGCCLWWSSAHHRQTGSSSSTLLCLVLLRSPDVHRCATGTRLSSS